MKVDYDAIHYSRENDTNRSLARLVQALTNAMESNEITQVIPIPFEWTICTYCEGNGGHSRHLGIITQERHDEWDDDTRNAYRAGAYDTKCESCNGSGKTREITTAGLPQDVQNFITDYVDNARESALEAYYERLAGC